MATGESVRKCRAPHHFHDWRLVDPNEPPPRRAVCQHCGKHIPAEPSDDDYEQYRSEVTR